MSEFLGVGGYYFFASVLARSRATLLALESGKEWVRDIARATSSATEPAHV